MTRTSSNPFRGFADMMSEMDRMRRLGKSGHQPVYEEPARSHVDAWIPAADIYADGDDLVIRIDLSGVPAEQITLEFSDGVLSVSGERDTDPAGDVTFYTRELYSGPFRRSMILPEGIDESRISASFRNGIAEVTVRGAAADEGPEPHRIPIEDHSGQEIPLGSPRAPVR